MCHRGLPVGAERHADFLARASTSAFSMISQFFPNRVGACHNRSRTFGQFIDEIIELPLHLTNPIDMRPQLRAFGSSVARNNSNCSSKSDLGGIHPGVLKQ